MLTVPLTDRLQRLYDLRRMVDVEIRREEEKLRDWWENSPATKREHRPNEGPALREWAREHGFEMADRGPIPRQVRAAYDERGDT